MKLLKNRRGQAVFESVLVMIIVISIWTGLTAALRNMQFFQTLFGTPWERLQNTMEFGIPTATRATAASHHPTSYDRHSTVLNEQ